MLAQVCEELDILWSSHSRRETAGNKSSLARLSKPWKRRFCRVFAAILWIEPRIKDTCPLVSCSKTTAAYKYPVNSSERKLDGKQRAEYSHRLCYSSCSSLASLQI